MTSLLYLLLYEIVCLCSTLFQRDLGYVSWQFVFVEWFLFIRKHHLRAFPPEITLEENVTFDGESKSNTIIFLDITGKCLASHVKDFLVSALYSNYCCDLILIETNASLAHNSTFKL